MMNIKAVFYSKAEKKIEKTSSKTEIIKNRLFTKLNLF